MDELFDDILDEIKNVDENNIKKFNEDELNYIELPFNIITKHYNMEPDININKLPLQMQCAPNIPFNESNNLEEWVDTLIDEPLALCVNNNHDFRNKCLSKALNMYGGVSEIDNGLKPSKPPKVMDIYTDVNGKLESFVERIDINAEDSAYNSSSLLRKPASNGIDYARGSYSNLAFRPGGFDSPKNNNENKDDENNNNNVKFPWIDNNDNNNNELKLRLPDAEHDYNNEKYSINNMEESINGYNYRGNWIDILDNDDKTNNDTIIHSSEMKIDHNLINIQNNNQKLQYDDIFAQLDNLRILSDDDDDDDDDGINNNENIEEEKTEEKEVEKLLKETDVLSISTSKNLLTTTTTFNEKTNKSKRKQWAIMTPISTENFHQQIPNPPIWFKFELDDFQKQAILHLERGESVFVSAHTSAGKTVVAEYAVALCSKHLTRAIYTSPIKTLSNQKFREFRSTFGENEVGIMTGDVSINSEAPCVILTTEILRSMLYRGADLIRDIEWVIFDEVHYINDLERGVVWEEVIIMLPAHVKIIMLSATVPNTQDFADWVGRTKQQEIHVISTIKRPVPLQHYLWHDGKMFNILDMHGKFHIQSFKRARESNKPLPINQKNNNNKDKKGKFIPRNPNKHARQQWGNSKATRNSGRSEKNEWLKLIKFLQKQQLLPLAVFSFSKRQCDESAFGIHSLDLNTNQEKSQIHIFLSTALNRLSDNDAELPQVQRVKQLILNGIGVHHAGMLPILKEIVEMMFARGLVKVLFATETFAMGVNMPARTVVFNGIRKHDGKEFRNLLSGEYTQMSGRAGRRGLDSFGVVAINCRHGEVPESWEVKNMITGVATQLQSQFRLTYSMMLNLLRQEDMQVEDMIRRSFLEVYNNRDAPKREKQLINDEKELEELHSIDCIHSEPESIELYYNIYRRSSEINKEVMNEFVKSGKYTTLLSLGRVILVTKYNLIRVLGIVISTNNINTSSRHQITVLVLCPPTWKPLPTYENIIKHSFIDSITYATMYITPNDIDTITDTKFNTRNHNTNIEWFVSKLKDIKKLSLKSINPFNEINLSVDIATEWMKKVEWDLEIENNICNNCPLLNNHFELIQKRHTLQTRINNAKTILSDDNLYLKGDFQSKLNVLQHLQYVDRENTVQLKGRVACEINTCDALIVTELLFENAFTELSPSEIASMLSCLIFQEKNADDPNLTPNLQQCEIWLRNTTERLANLQLECGVDIIIEDYIKENIHIGMMEVVYEWMNGTSFNRICELTNILEGSIVRCITRLDETCHDIRNAARVIGDPLLYEKMETASTLMKRDIVFAGSLYLQ